MTTKDKYIQRLEELNDCLKKHSTMAYLNACTDYVNLESELSSLKAEMEKGEWIDINVRLPDDSCSIIVATDQGGIGEMWFSKEYKFHKLKNDATVTHWMPLPKLPIKSKTE